MGLPTAGFRSSKMTLRFYIQNRKKLAHYMFCLFRISLQVAANYQHYHLKVRFQLREIMENKGCEEQNGRHWDQPAVDQLWQSINYHSHQGGRRFTLMQHVQEEGSPWPLAGEVPKAYRSQPAHGHIWKHDLIRILNILQIIDFQSANRVGAKRSDLGSY